MKKKVTVSPVDSHSDILLLYKCCNLQQIQIIPFWQSICICWSRHRFYCIRSVNTFFYRVIYLFPCNALLQFLSTERKMEKKCNEWRDYFFFYINITHSFTGSVHFQFLLYKSTLFFFDSYNHFDCIQICSIYFSLDIFTIKSMSAYLNTKLNPLRVNKIISELYQNYH